MFLLSHLILGTFWGPIADPGSSKPVQVLSTLHPDSDTSSRISNHWENWNLSCFALFAWATSMWSVYWEKQAWTHRSSLVKDKFFGSFWLYTGSFPTNEKNNWQAHCGNCRSLEGVGALVPRPGLDWISGRYLCSIQTADLFKLAGCPCFQKVNVSGGG